MQTTRMQKLRTLVIGLCLVILTGCKVQLYTGLTEKEGNDMLAILLDSDIQAEKAIDKDGIVTLTVGTDDVSRAIRLLRGHGFPKDRFSSVSDIFPKDSLISSPTEEKARYTYSMSQELSATLSMIDGVLTARVHVVLPQDSGANEDNFPSSSSVFIKYTPDLELTGFVPKVKTLVANSIEGLSLDKITVSLFPAVQASPERVLLPQELDSVLSIDVTPESSARLLLIVGGMAALSLLTLGISLLFFFLWWRQRTAAHQSDRDDGYVQADMAEIENIEAG